MVDRFNPGGGENEKVRHYSDCQGFKLFPLATVTHTRKGIKAKVTNYEDLLNSCGAQIVLPFFYLTKNIKKI